ncbi:MAG: histidinol-phosphate transaminase [Gammaproteobacteria bacterium]|nr:histidinol-phosphate transaminase [Gammaproteobacteria bacterium]|tara:strand:+ start:316 stop:1428 length:1113 start_codon:yes stop_codon:yes gene_type:complete
MSKKMSIFTYRPGKSISSVEKQYNIKNVIKLASNENPFGPSSKALKTVKKELNQINRYPESNPIALKLQLVKELKQKNITVDNLIIGNGSNEILDFAARAYILKKDEVIFSKHSFLVYKIIANIMHAKVVETKPILSKDDYYLGTDLSNIHNKINKKTKLIFIANPNNPTGTILDVKEIESFLNSIPKRIIVVIDEAYAEYAEYRNKTSALTLLKRYSNILITRTFSKIHALAGLRIGYGIGSKDIIKTLNYFRQPFNTNTFAQLLAVECLKDKKYIIDSLKHNLNGINFLKEELNKLGLDCLSSYGNFITFKLGARTSTIFKKLLSNGIILRPLDNYSLSNFLRVTVGKNSENNRFISVLKKILNVRKV